MSKLSGIRDLDREILGKVDDVELLKVCSIDKYTWNIVCDDAFLKRRLLAKYPQIESYKSKGLSWKHFFLKVIHYISLLKKEYNYEYTFGDCVIQYYTFKKYHFDKDSLFLESVKIGEIALVTWCLNNGANINIDYNVGIKLAIEFGNLEIVKHLIERGSDFRFNNDSLLRSACKNGHLEIVKYFVEHGADIHAKNNDSLNWARWNGHLEVVKYLKSKM